jgi:hypothetical protein
MKTYKVTLHIAASSPQELEEKLQAFQNLQDHLSHEDFIQAATVVVENPALIEFIKEVAPEEGQELSLGDYLSIARKAFTRFG